MQGCQLGLIKLLELVELAPNVTPGGGTAFSTHVNTLGAVCGDL